MYENRSYTIITTIEIGDEVYDKIDNLEVGGVLKRLVKELIKGIKQNLSKSDDIFFKYAYENADVLHNIVQYTPKKEGGSYKNGIVYVGDLGFTSSDMGSDGDIIGTIFHEFMHHIAFKLDIYPKRYDNIEKGEVFYENIDIDDRENSIREFYQTEYLSFLSHKMATDDQEILDKYLDYPDRYTKLDNHQKQEVHSYIEQKGAKRESDIAQYRYIPSNHFKDEVNAHQKTLEGHRLGVFTMSKKKVSFYDSEIESYNKSYAESIQIENKYGYSPEGYKK